MIPKVDHRTFIMNLDYHGGYLVMETNWVINQHLVLVSSRKHFKNENSACINAVCQFLIDYVDLFGTREQGEKWIWLLRWEDWGWNAWI